MATCATPPRDDCCGAQPCAPPLHHPEVVQENWQVGQVDVSVLNFLVFILDPYCNSLPLAFGPICRV